MLRLVCTLVLTLVVITSSGLAQKAAARPETCDPAKFDSKWTESAPVYRSCEVEREATLLGTAPAPKWTPPSDRRGCYAAVVDFVVDTLGVPESHSGRVVHATDPTLAAAVLASMPGRRYSVAAKDGHAVRQAIRDSIVVMAVDGTLVTAEPLFVGRLSGDMTYRSQVPARLARSRCKP